MKTAEELNTLKKEYETLTTKLKELTENELKQVTGGKMTSDDDDFTKITKALTELGNIAWAIPIEWNGLWSDINQAENTKDLGIRLNCIANAQGKVDTYKIELGNQCEYMRERLQYCYDETYKQMQGK